jgi:hypothetical protein
MTTLTIALPDSLKAFLRLQPLAEFGIERDAVGRQSLQQQRFQTAVFLPGLRFAQQAAHILADVAIAFVGDLSVDELAAITGLRVDLVSAAALKPYIGERVRAEAIAL